MTTTAPAREADIHRHRGDQRARIVEQTFVARRADGPAQRNAGTARRCRWSSSRVRAAAGYRDLGGDNGHLWGFVQSIKRPALLEIWGPLFMSTAATSNLIYRLTNARRARSSSSRTRSWGRFPEDHRPGSARDGRALHARVRTAAEAG